MRIILIHGTNDGEPTKDKHRWWEEESAFVKELSQHPALIGRTCRIEHFLWHDGKPDGQRSFGPNSERIRREAGERLYSLVNSASNASDEIVLVGHSHGGSVIEHALIEASMRGEILPSLSKWITVGTPFIRTRPAKFGLSHFNTIGKIIAVTTASITTILLLAPLILAFSPGIDQSSLLLMMILSSISFVFVLLSAIWLYRRETEKTRLRHASATIDFFEQQFVNRWVGFCAENDEALGGLVSAATASVPIFKPIGINGGLMKAFDLVAFLTVIVIAIIGVIYNVFDLADSIAEEDLYGDIIFDDTTIPALAAFLLVPWLGGLSFGLFYLIYRIIARAASIGLSTHLSRILNSFSTKQLRLSCYGMDIPSEIVGAVHSFPIRSNARDTSLPSEIEEQLRQFANAGGSSTLAKMRKSFVAAPAAAGNSSIFLSMANEITWDELIHTAYFKVELFIERLITEIFES